jgi:hypothetical protein
MDHIENWVGGYTDIQTARWYDKPPFSFQNKETRLQNKFGKFWEQPAYGYVCDPKFSKLKNQWGNSAGLFKTVSRQFMQIS